MAIMLIVFANKNPKPSYSTNKNLCTIPSIVSGEELTKTKTPIPNRIQYPKVAIIRKVNNFGLLSYLHNR